MPRALKTSAAQMVADARTRIEEIGAAQAIPLMNTPNTVIVDLRDIRERQREGFIPGAFHCPRGMVEFWVDPNSPYFKEVFNREATFVFHCASGWRSAITVDTLTKMGFEGAAHIEGGFSAWKQAGGPIETAPDKSKG